MVFQHDAPVSIPTALVLFIHPVHCLISGLAGATKAHNKASQK